MGYLLVFAIILTYAITLAIVLNKRIEKVIPISIVEIVTIIFLTGLLDNLQLGVFIVELLTIIQLLFILIIVIRKYKDNSIGDLVKSVLTPGLLIYTILYVLAIVINKDRIFEDYDEFNHWAVIVKNMFMYNTYGTNPETIVRFNEYPPFTAVFQYIFLALQKAYREDTIIIAQNILYFSIIIPVTQNIKWNKTLKRLVTIVPIIIFLPMIFYKNFYLDILVDAILGIMFAYTIFAAFGKEELKFKFFKILAGEIMLCLTKTSGIGLALLAMIIIFIKIIIDKKENKSIFKKQICAIITLMLIVITLTSIWYLKVNNAQKRWDFSQYVETENKTIDDKKEIAQNFASEIFTRQDLIDGRFTVFNIVLVLIAFQILSIQNIKEKGYKYYSWAMLISIPIYLILLLITYMTIFNLSEAQRLTCFDRYSSTILLAYITFQLFVMSKLEIKESRGRALLIIAIILALLPKENIESKYIYGENYIKTAQINREIYTEFVNYKEKLKPTDKILFIVSIKDNEEYMASMNRYELMPIKIGKTMVGRFKTQQAFEDIVKEYTHIYIYRIEEEQKEKIKNFFKYHYIQRDTLYKVNIQNEKLLLEAIL